MSVERELILVKPEAFRANKTGDILAAIQENIECKLVALGVFRFDEETAEEFYQEHAGKDFFDKLIEYMTSDQCAAIVIEAEDAVRRVRELVGDTDSRKAKPGTLRHMFGTDKTHNAVHASATVEDAKREAPLVFMHVELMLFSNEMEVLPGTS